MLGLRPGDGRDHRGRADHLAGLRDQPHILQSGANSVSALIALRYGESDAARLSALMAAGLVLFLITLVVNFARRPRSSPVAAPARASGRTEGASTTAIRRGPRCGRSAAPPHATSSTPRQPSPVRRRRPPTGRPGRRPAAARRPPERRRSRGVTARHRRATRCWARPPARSLTWLVYERLAAVHRRAGLRGRAGTSLFLAALRPLVLVRRGTAPAVRDRIAVGWSPEPRAVMLVALARRSGRLHRLCAGRQVAAAPQLLHPGHGRAPARSTR